MLNARSAAAGRAPSRPPRAPARCEQAFGAADLEPNRPERRVEPDGAARQRAGVGERQRADPAAEDDVDLAVAELRDRRSALAACRSIARTWDCQSRSSGMPRAAGGFIDSTAASPLRTSRMSPLPPLPCTSSSSGWASSWSSIGTGLDKADLDHPAGHRAHFGDRLEVEPERGAAELAQRLDERGARAFGGELAAVGQVPSRSRKMKLRPSSVTIQRSASAGMTLAVGVERDEAGAGRRVYVLRARRQPQAAPNSCAGVSMKATWTRRRCARTRPARMPAGQQRGRDAAP
jgi:hypothetical protein